MATKESDRFSPGSSFPSKLRVFCDVSSHCQVKQVQKGAETTEAEAAGGKRRRSDPKTSWQKSACARKTASATSDTARRWARTRVSSVERTLGPKAKVATISARRSSMTPGENPSFKRAAAAGHIALIAAKERSARSFSATALSFSLFVALAFFAARASCINCQLRCGCFRSPGGGGRAKATNMSMSAASAAAALSACKPCPPRSPTNKPRSASILKSTAPPASANDCGPKRLRNKQ